MNDDWKSGTIHLTNWDGQCQTVLEMWRHVSEFHKEIPFYMFL